MPYKGSKNAIARDIVEFLPKADVLVDICAGGCAVTHCALESGKWAKVVANDINPMPVMLFWDAMHGKFRDETRWISREDFKALRDSDPYVKYCWSFGNNGKDYLYGADIEELKRGLHEMLFAETVSERYALWRTLWRTIRTSTAANKDRQLGELQNLEGLQRLESVERLQNLERLDDTQRRDGSIRGGAELEISSLDYADVPIPDGAVIYADIPYENTNCGSYQGFDSVRFYDWAAAQDVPVYFSSYDISDGRFPVVWSKTKSVLSTNNGTSGKALERIYANGAGVERLAKVDAQMSIFDEVV